MNFMNRLLSLVSCLFFATLSCTAQSAITVTLDGGHRLYTGAQVKYTHSFKTVQLGAFVTPTYYDQDFLMRLGICINSVPLKKKDASLYYGFAAEGYSVLQKAGYADKALMAGLHLGVNVKLKERLYLNSEWGARAGALFSEKYQQSPGAVRYGYPGNYYKDRDRFFYFPASLGLTYVFGGKRDKI